MLSPFSLDALASDARWGSYSEIQSSCFSFCFLSLYIASRQKNVHKTCLLFFYYLMLEVLSTFNIVLRLFVDKLTVLKVQIFLE